MVRGPGWRPAENDADAAKIAEGKVAENAKALGDEIASIYGKEAGDKLFGLLAGHYGAAKDYMTAAFAGNADTKGAAVKKLKKNAESNLCVLIASFSFISCRSCRCLTAYMSSLL